MKNPVEALKDLTEAVKPFVRTYGEQRAYASPSTPLRGLDDADIVSIVVASGKAELLLKTSPDDEAVLQSIGTLTEAIDPLVRAYGGIAWPPAGLDDVNMLQIEMAHSAAQRVIEENRVPAP